MSVNNTVIFLTSLETAVCCVALHPSTYCLPHFIHLLTFSFLGLKPINQLMLQSLIEKPKKYNPVTQMS